MELFTQLVLGLWVLLVFVGLVFFFAEFSEYGDEPEVPDWMINTWKYSFVINVVLTFVWVELTIFGA